MRICIGVVIGTSQNRTPLWCLVEAVLKGRPAKPGPRAYTCLFEGITMNYELFQDGFKLASQFYPDGSPPEPVKIPESNQPDPFYEGFNCYCEDMYHD